MPNPRRISGGNGASKSSLIQILPLSMPSVLRTSFFFSSGTNRTLGSPAFGDDDFFAGSGLLDEARKVSLGGVDVDRLHKLD